MALSVVLIEDSPLLRHSLRRQLDGLGGFSIAAELTGETAALQWLAGQSGRWDVALIDLVLEQGTGMAVLSACKAQPDAGTVAVFSAYVTPEVRAHCLRLGADAVFQKGRDGTALAEWLQALPGR